MGISRLMEVIQEHAPSAIQIISGRDLEGKVVAIDAYISICQAQAYAKQDRNGWVTEMFQRTVDLIECGIKPVYVFDGPPPLLKKEELLKRAERRAAAANWISEGASLSLPVKVIPTHVTTCKSMFDLMGVPYVNATGEGEAQCVELVKKGKCYGVSSTDTDVLAFGCDMLLIGPKPRVVDIKHIKLDKVLQQMNLSNAAFIDLCILLGCDYLPTIKGIGKVKAVKLIKEYGSIEHAVSTLDKSKHPVSKEWLTRLTECRKYFKAPSVKDGNSISLKWSTPNDRSLTSFLSDRSASSDWVRARIAILNEHLVARPERCVNGAITGSLLDVAAAFLNSLDVFPDNYTQLYRSEWKAFFQHFTKRNASARSYSSDQVISFLKRKKFVYFKHSQIVLKPLYINIHDGKYVMFTIQPGTLRSSTFVVCLVCDRGFPTAHGHASHMASDGHLNSVTSLIEDTTKSQDKYTCRIQNCAKQFAKLQELASHMMREEYLKVDNRVKEAAANSAAVTSRDDGMLTCELCSVTCNSQFNMEQHLKGKRHMMKANKDAYRKSRIAFLRNASNVSISFEGEGETEADSVVLSVIGEANTTRSVEFKIVNTSPNEPITLESFSTPSIMPGVTANIVKQVRPHIMAPLANLRLHIQIRPTYLGRVRVPVLFIFNRNGQRITLSREILYKCVANQNMFRDLQPSTPYVKPKVKALTHHDVIRSDTKPDFEKNYALEMVDKLGIYSTPASVIKVLKNLKDSSAERRLDMLSSELNLEELDYSNYSTYFNNLLYLEENQLKIDIAYYGMFGVPMTKDSRTGLVRLTVPGLAENRPSVLRGDKLYATQLPGDGKSKFEGYVHNVTLNELFLGFHKRLTNNFINKMMFNVEFTINRLSIRLEHRACTSAGLPKICLQNVLFPSAPPTLPPFHSPQTLSLRFLDKRVNVEQRAAIKHIVCGTSRPAPYLIYGPPGTGKTVTLVEAIKQVHREFPNSRILACAPQNAAADLLTSRLIEHIPVKDVLRLNALSRAYGDIDPQVQKVSNYRSKTGVVTHLSNALISASKRGDMEVEYPCSDELKRKRILVSTLVTSGRLVSADMKNHFTHIFIDEAGHATEPETVIPLSGLLNIKMADGGQVVLAGDPKQLGPVIRSHIASNRGLGKSLLERLMSIDLYSRNKTSGEFNQNYVTKLVRSFRSHPAILEVPNSCFYDNELQACADTMQREKFCNWEELPTKNFPLIFHGIDGEEEQEGKSPSWFNRYEVLQVINYVQKLFDCKSPKVKPEHVGIISPYHQQVNKISQALRALETKNVGHTRNFSKIKVGSVEKFQGDERDVIIISTVRSQDSFLTHDKEFNLGFVRNPKRFNVAVTRAKALLIVIGNPAILRQDKNWLGLLSHIEEGGGYVGSPLPEDIESEEPVDKLSELLETMCIQEILEEPSKLMLHVHPEFHRKE